MEKRVRIEKVEKIRAEEAISNVGVQYDTVLNMEKQYLQTLRETDISAITRRVSGDGNYWDMELIPKLLAYNNEKKTLELNLRRHALTIQNYNYRISRARRVGIRAENSGFDVSAEAEKLFGDLDKQYERAPATEMVGMPGPNEKAYMRAEDESLLLAEKEFTGTNKGIDVTEMNAFKKDLLVVMGIFPGAGSSSSSSGGGEQRVAIPTAAGVSTGRSGASIDFPYNNGGSAMQATRGVSSMDTEFEM
jgi:hypothetical protein